MIWFWIAFAVLVVLAFAWVARRSRRHSGDYTMEQAARDADKYAGGGTTGVA
jgi:hypothetical protein